MEFSLVLLERPSKRYHPAAYLFRNKGTEMYLVNVDRNTGYSR
jgi:hypothetical protein